LNFILLLSNIYWVSYVRRRPSDWCTTSRPTAALSS